MSIISDAQDALEAILTAACTGYTVEYGLPLPTQTPERGVFIAEHVQSALSTPMSGNPAAQDATFTLKVLVHDHRTGKTAKEMRALADAGEALAVAAIRANPTLSGTVSFCTVERTERAGGFWDTNGTARFDERGLELTCKAYSG